MGVSCGGGGGGGGEVMGGEREGATRHGSILWRRWGGGSSYGGRERKSYKTWEYLVEEVVGGGGSYGGRERRSYKTWESLPPYLVDKSGIGASEQQPLHHFHAPSSYCQVQQGVTLLKTFGFLTLSLPFLPLSHSENHQRKCQITNGSDKSKIIPPTPLTSPRPARSHVHVKGSLSKCTVLKADLL